MSTHSTPVSKAPSPSHSVSPVSFVPTRSKSQPNLSYPPNSPETSSPCSGTSSKDKGSDCGSPPHNDYGAHSIKLDIACGWVWERGIDPTTEFILGCPVWLGGMWVARAQWLNVNFELSVGLVPHHRLEWTPYFGVSDVCLTLPLWLIRVRYYCRSIEGIRAWIYCVVFRLIWDWL